MKIQTLLNEEIEAEFEKLKDMEKGTEEYKTTVDGLTKLVEKSNEMTKFEIEHDEKVKQMKEEKKDRVIKNVLTACGIIVPTIVTIWGTKASFEFEKEGTITTIMGRGFINKLLPKK